MERGEKRGYWRKSALIYIERSGRGKLDTRLGSCTCCISTIVLVFDALDESNADERKEAMWHGLRPGVYYDCLLWIT